MIQNNPPVGPNQHLIQDAYQLAPPIYNKQHTGPLAVATDHHQIQTTGNVKDPTVEEISLDTNETTNVTDVQQILPEIESPKETKEKSPSAI